MRLTPRRNQVARLTQGHTSGRSPRRKGNHEGKMMFDSRPAYTPKVAHRRSAFKAVFTPRRKANAVFPLA